MTVRRLLLTDAPLLPALRSEALKACPDAFGEAWEDFEALGPEGRARWAHDCLNQPDSAMWGAFLGDRLVGMAGLFRRAQLKSRHKVGIWGVYVAAEGRGQGLGRALMEAAIAHARILPGVDRINLTCNPDRPAYRLYRSLGFLEWGREPAGLRVDGRDLEEAYLTLRL